MSAAPEQRAWRGNRPPSISRAPIPPSKSSTTSPNTSGTTTPNHNLSSKLDNSKPVATAKPVEQTVSQPKQAPAPSNIWESRKAAAQARAASTSAQNPPTASQTASQIIEPAAKTGDRTGATTKALNVGDDDASFNSADAQRFLRRDSAIMKLYQSSESASRSATAAAKGVMANGQNFYAQLNKQIGQLQNGA